MKINPNQIQNFNITTQRKQSTNLQNNCSKPNNPQNSPIYSYGCISPYLGKSSISFGTNKRCYLNDVTNEEILTQTQINRPDLDFKNFAKLAFENFKDASLVKIYNMACSDGSEPYTIAMHLNEINELEAKKFLPIIASDRDATIISYAKLEKINMTQNDFKNLSNNGINYKKYFEKFYEYDINISNDKLEEKTESYTIKDTLKNSVNFSKKTILQQVNEIERNEPKIILCRNVFPYLGSENEKFKHLFEIYKKLQKNDLLVIGDFDRNNQMNKNLQMLGLKEVQKNVFKKIK